MVSDFGISLGGSQGRQAAGGRQPGSPKTPPPGRCERRNFLDSIFSKSQNFHWVGLWVRSRNRESMMLRNHGEHTDWPRMRRVSQLGKLCSPKDVATKEHAKFEVECQPPWCGICRVDNLRRLPARIFARMYLFAVVVRLHVLASDSFGSDLHGATFLASPPVFLYYAGSLLECTLLQ